MHPQNCHQTTLETSGCCTKMVLWPRVSLLQIDAFSDKIPQPLTMDFTE